MHFYITAINNSKKELRKHNISNSIKRRKYLINLSKEAKDLHTQNYNMILKEIKDLNKCK